MLVKERTLRLVSQLSSGGMGPVTSPGKRTSWVNSARSEMEGESEPARPDEPERPVPRVRVETRLSEQVMPEKVEQGSGAVRFQVEKKLLPGMSVSVLLMAAKAAKSTALIL